MRARRALLYMPGDDRHKIEKAARLGVDCICMDLEDGVALTRKGEARQVVAAALGELDFGRAEKLVRINPAGSGLEEADLQAVLPAGPDGIVVPKVETPEQLAWVAGQLEAAELAHGWRVNSIRMIPIVESARGILNLKDIAAAPRLEALIFGAEDLAADLGAVRTQEAWEVFYGRSALLMAAAAGGLQGIDMVSTDFKNLEALHAEALFGMRMGFSGKQVIHPDQVAPVQSAFTPDDESIARASALVQAFEEQQARGSGAFALDGRLVDMPVIKAAQNLLERARAAGKFKP
jgi:citrate lyase beta subunit